MRLARFFSYFMRVRPEDPDNVTIKFELRHGSERNLLGVHAVQFDVEANAWTVTLERTA